MRPIVASCGTMHARSYRVKRLLGTLWSSVSRGLIPLQTEMLALRERYQRCKFFEPCQQRERDNLKDTRSVVSSLLRMRKMDRLRSNNA